MEQYKHSPDHVFLFGNTIPKIAAMPQTKANKTRQAYQTYKHQVRAGKSNLEAHKQKVILIDLVQIGRAKNGLRFTFEITGGLHTLRVLNCGGSTLERNVHTTFVWGK